MTDEEQYEKDLRRRQEEHLRGVRRGWGRMPWAPCAHNQCAECVGTGVRKDGSACVHMLYCSCPRCSPWCMSADGAQTTAQSGPDGWQCVGVHEDPERLDVYLSHDRPPGSQRP